MVRKSSLRHGLINVLNVKKHALPLNDYGNGVLEVIYMIDRFCNHFTKMTLTLTIFNGQCLEFKEVKIAFHFSV